MPRVSAEDARADTGATPTKDESQSQSEVGNPSAAGNGKGAIMEKAADKFIGFFDSRLFKAVAWISIIFGFLYFGSMAIYGWMFHEARVKQDQCWVKLTEKRFDQIARKHFGRGVNFVIRDWPERTYFIRGGRKCRFI